VSDPRCSECGYDVSGLALDEGRVRCPECGHFGSPLVAKTSGSGRWIGASFGAGLGAGILLMLAGSGAPRGWSSDVRVAIVLAGAPIGAIVAVNVARARRRPIELGGTASGALAGIGILVFIVNMLIVALLAAAMTVAEL
jgi:hypothetical protein